MCLGLDRTLVVPQWQSWWCLSGVSLVSLWCLSGVSLVFWWCLGDVLVVSWRLDGVSMVSCGFDGVSVWCPGGASDSVVPRWCLRCIHADTRCPRVLVASCWCCVGGAPAVVLVIGWLHLGGVSLCVTQVLKFFFLVVHTMRVVIFNGSILCHAGDHHC